MFRKSFTVVVLVLIAACSKGDKTGKGESSGEATPESSPPTVPVYRAFGNEPFWSVTINANGLHFDSPEDSAGVDFPPAEAVASGDTLHWVSKSDHGRIDVRIWPGTCSDGMSDHVWTHVSAVTLNETSYLGCAETPAKPVR